MTEIPAFSPGCFGSALAFDKQNPGCNACVFNAQCEPLHKINLLALQDHFGVNEAPAKRAASIKLAGRSRPSINVFSPAVREMIQKIEKGDFRIIEKMQNGENPFDGSFQFMRVACHLLMRMMKPLPQPYLATCLITKLGCTSAEATTYSRIAFQSLAYIGAIDVDQGSATLRRL